MGAQRSIICDTQNNKYYFIPNGLYLILKNYNGQTIDFVKTQYNNNFDTIIDEYFDFLLSNNLIFFHLEPSLFPKINIEWSSPSTITNFLLDFDKIEHNILELILQLELLKCSHIQLRFFRKININRISEILNTIAEQKSRILSIDIIMPFNKKTSHLSLNSLILDNPRVHSITLFNSPMNTTSEPIRGDMGYLNHTQKNIINEKHCGIISNEYFYANIKLFSESQRHNTCLNRKISVDKDGEIKNCPSLTQSFGNIKNTTLQEAINHPSFKKYWNISKDKIDICKVCEFRHVCTDCRAFVEEPNNIYSKPLKCGYDPYTNKWSEWSTNSLKEMAIDYYGLQELVKKE